MTQVEKRRRWRPLASAAALAVAAGLVAAPAQAQEDGGYEDLLTDHVVEIEETVSDAGFVHPGVGLSAEDLRNAQDMVRSGEEPWASYFEAMTESGRWAETGYQPNNMVKGEPDQPVTECFNPDNDMRGRMTVDSFGALTQSLMWVMTGDEIYRKNAMWTLRTWSNMNPDCFEYSADYHIHTGKPLSQFLMAAEIIRATEPVEDDSPGEQDGYDVVWSDEDDAKLLGNLANPVMEEFNYSNEKWMNQHNFGLYGRIATAIYADDAEGYATGVEWFTVNSTFDHYRNGSVAEQIRYIEADDPLNPYGHGFTQVREMGRDQAHGETNIDNFAALARFLDVQGTLVDPADGTVSTADDAVTAYGFLDDRLLHGADAFYGFMMGEPTPWVDERETGGTISQAYRGRVFNPLSELYYQYTYDEGVDVEAEAPHLAELHERMDGPYYKYGTGTKNFWAAGDKSVEYWVAFPPELADTEPTPVEDTEVTFGRYAIPLDEGTEIVTEDDRTFARATADADGTTSAVSRLMYSGGTDMGLLVRTDGPATLEVLDKEEPGANPDETDPSVMATVELPDTQGQWRYVTYPAQGRNVHFYRLSGDDATVDLDTVLFDAGSQLTPPVFEQVADRLYFWAGAESEFDLSATDEGGSVAYSAEGLPAGATLDAETGTLTWKPTEHGCGGFDVRVVADDGESVDARTFELVAAEDRAELIEKLLDDEVDEDDEYTTVTREPFEAALDAAEQAAEAGTDEEFRAAFTELQTAISGLKLLNPHLDDGSLDYRGIVTPWTMDDNGVNALADGDNTSHGGDLHNRSAYLDFGPGYRVSAERFGIQARYAFPMRSQGTNVYGSNNGIDWTLLSSRETTETNDMETIPVVDDHEGEAYRYFKLQVDNPGVTIDPAYPHVWSLGEFRVFGERSEVAGDITDVSLSAEGTVKDRVTEGDTVTVDITAREPISDVAVTVGGREAAVAGEDGENWTATVELGEIDDAGLLPVTVDHTTADGRTAEPVTGTTDGSHLYASDERNLLDLGLAQAVGPDGQPDEEAADQAARVVDGDAGTATDIGELHEEASLIWDFGESAEVTLDRADFLARQNRTGSTWMENQVIEGSNDLENWTTLTGPTTGEWYWQNLESDDEGAYRYLRVHNGNGIGIAELRLFGDFTMDLGVLLERADAVDLSLHSRASGILFDREVEAVRTAASEDGADEDALVDRLLDAWDLLEDPPSAVMDIDPSWVSASSESWDGSHDAAANGWLMFDGDSSTFTDTTDAEGWVQVVPDDGRVLTVEIVRVQPRSGHAHRANGFQVQGSNDGGQTWETFQEISTPASGGWTEFELDEPVKYEALRLYSPNGYTNLAELQFVRVPVDATGLDLYLDETAELDEPDWTAGTWADLTEAREAGLALRDAGADPTQEEVDDAAEAIAAAVAALEAAE